MNNAKNTLSDARDTCDDAPGACNDVEYTCDDVKRTSAAESVRLVEAMSSGTSTGRHFIYNFTAVGANLKFTRVELRHSVLFLV